MPQLLSPYAATTERSPHTLEPALRNKRTHRNKKLCTFLEGSLHSLQLEKARAFSVGSVVKNSPDNAGDMRDVGSIPGSGRFPGEGSGNPLQCSCLENPMDRGTWWAIVHGVMKSRT